LVSSHLPLAKTTSLIQLEALRLQNDAQTGNAGFGLCEFAEFDGACFKAQREIT
jgi:hypothetical protein